MAVFTKKKHNTGVHAVQEGQYGEAFELTSNNRVDLNVIVDYAWPKFLTHAEDFVREVQVRAPLNLPWLPLSPWPSVSFHLCSGWGGPCFKPVCQTYISDAWVVPKSVLACHPVCDSLTECLSLRRRRWL